MKKAIPYLISLGIICLVVFYSPWQLSKHWLYNTPKKYQRELRSIREKRMALAKQQASKAIVEAAFIQTVSRRLIPHWYGTFWSFNGTTQTPGRGSIACGYFVTTVLRDAGLAIQRSSLAQMPSEQMIQMLVAEKYIQRFSNRPLDKFIGKIQTSGRGLYIVGLDSHTGFLVNDENGIYFIHASGAYPFCVISEKAANAAILKKSAYRIVGKISEDPAVLQHWLQV